MFLFRIIPEVPTNEIRKIKIRNIGTKVRKLSIFRQPDCLQQIRKSLNSTGNLLKSGAFRMLQSAKSTYKNQVYFCVLGNQPLEANISLIPFTISLKYCNTNVYKSNKTYAISVC